MVSLEVPLKDLAFLKFPQKNLNLYGISMRHQEEVKISLSYPFMQYLVFWGVLERLWQGLKVKQS